MRRLAAAALLLWGCGGGAGDDADASPATDTGGRPADAASAPADAAPADAAPDATAADATPDTDALPPPVDEDVDWTPATPAALHADIPGAPTDRPAACGDRWVSVVRGWVAAPGGAPVPGAKAQFCVHTVPGDVLVCLRPATAGDDGVFTVEVPENTRCMSRAALRVLLPGTGKATTYCSVPLPEGEAVVRLEAPYVVFQTRPAVSLPPAGDDAATRPIAFDDGLVIDFTPEAFYSGGGDYAELGGRRVPVSARGLCFLEGQPAPDGLYAFFPEGSFSGSGAPVHIPNATGLPAGARVELNVLGGLDCRRPDGRIIPEASWEAIGTGTVSEDGARIDSDPGVGLPCLTWLGYRRAE